LDHKVEEEAAAQAAALAAGFEGRKMRRFLQRRTVDYMGSWMKYRDQRMRTSTPRGDYYLKPSPHWVVDVSLYMQ
jgi:polyadenylation factor subunit 2